MGKVIDLQTRQVDNTVKQFVQIITEACDDLQHPLFLDSIQRAIVACLESAAVTHYEDHGFSTDATIAVLKMLVVRVLINDDNMRVLFCDRFHTTTSVSESDAPFFEVSITRMSPEELMHQASPPIVPPGSIGEAILEYGLGTANPEVPRTSVLFLDIMNCFLTIINGPEQFVLRDVSGNSDVCPRNVRILMTGSKVKLIIYLDYSVLMQRVRLFEEALEQSVKTTQPGAW